MWLLFLAWFRYLARWLERRPVMNAEEGQWQGSAVYKWLACIEALCFNRVHPFALSLLSSRAQ